eukprot:6471948-Amphidinium_carterae.1
MHERLLRQFADSTDLGSRKRGCRNKTQSCHSPSLGPLRFVCTHRCTSCNSWRFYLYALDGSGEGLSAGANLVLFCKVLRTYVSDNVHGELVSFSRAKDGNEGYLT